MATTPQFPLSIQFLIIPNRVLTETEFLLLEEFEEMLGEQEEGFRIPVPEGVALESLSFEGALQLLISAVLQHS